MPDLVMFWLCCWRHIGHIRQTTSMYVPPVWLTSEFPGRHCFHLFGAEPGFTIAGCTSETKTGFLVQSMPKLSFVCRPMEVPLITVQDSLW